MQYTDRWLSWTEHSTHQNAPPPLSPLCSVFGVPVILSVRFSAQLFNRATYQYTLLLIQLVLTCITVLHVTLQLIHTYTINTKWRQYTYSVCLTAIFLQVTFKWKFWLHPTARFVEAMRNKTGGPTFDSRCGPWKFSSDLILLSTFSSPGVHSASNRNEHQGLSLSVHCGRRVELTTLPSTLVKGQLYLFPFILMAFMKVFLQCCTCLSCTAPKSNHPDTLLLWRHTDTVGYVCCGDEGKKSMGQGTKQQKKTVCVEDERACRCKKLQKQSCKYTALSVDGMYLLHSSQSFEISYRAENWPDERRTASHCFVGWKLCLDVGGGGGWGGGQCLGPILTVTNRRTQRTPTWSTQFRSSFSVIPYTHLVLCSYSVFTYKTVVADCTFHSATIFISVRKTPKSHYNFHVRQSVRPNGTTRLPPDGLSWNLIFGHFSKIFEKIQD